MADALEGGASRSRDHRHVGDGLGGLRRAGCEFRCAGGGGIAYPPERVHDTWASETKVWGNPIRTDGVRGLMDFSWEREWRIPSSTGGVTFQAGAIAAVLTGDPDWKPSPVGESWVNGVTGQPLPSPSIPEAISYLDYPAAWNIATHLYWDGTTLHHVS